ncbi:MAG: disulfide bond formation protein DsbA [Sandaracinus sp.]|nr:disulfide bond formation protein DsbA [Sandaracinus sp.]
MRIDIWSDIACPWCFVGKRRFNRALEGFDRRDEVEIHLRSFELDPSAPRQRPLEPDYVARLARKYGVPVPQAQAMVDRMAQTGAEEGITFRFDRIQPGNTFDAHRLLHLAAEHGRASELETALFRAYFEEGVAIGDPAALAPVATGIGLDADAVAATLASDAFADAVRADEEMAGALGIRGVPCFVIERQWAIQGAQDSEAVHSVLEKAFDELGAEVADADFCSADGACSPG